MKCLDEQIKIYFVDPNGISKSGVYRYDVILTDKNGNKLKTLFIGNTFLEANQSEVYIDITSIVRNHKKNNTLGYHYTVIEESTILCFFDVILYGANGEENTSEDYLMVNMMYHYPHYSQEMNNGLDYSTNNAGSLWVSLQGRYGENGIGKFKLCPRYPLKSTENYKLTIAGYAGNNTLNNSNIKINGTVITTKFKPTYNNYFWSVPLTLIVPHVSTNKQESIVDIAGDEVAILEKCYSRYYLMWQDRAGSYQSQPFSKVETFSESFEREYVTDSNGYKNINTITVKPKIKIQTGFIEDNLYPYYESIFISPVLVLYDTEEDKSYKVNVTGDYTEKTFKNQGRQFFNLQLDLEFAQNQNLIY